MKKVFDFGKKAVANRKIRNNRITIEIELKQTSKGEEFTASADVWNSKNTDIIMGGQCLDKLMPYLKNNKTYKTILDLWHKYHLNGMRAWCQCEHTENPSEKIKVYKLRYNEEGERLSRIRDLGIFKQFITVTEEGMKNIPSALYEICAYKSLGDTGIEEKTRGWITYDAILSPEGLIGKECPTCGAKYGHGWYFHPIPENDLNTIKELINS
jgi:hypothetical protein